MSRAKRALEHALQQALRPLETRLRRESAAGGSGHAPVFIVGPPRTGSTLLYQLIVRRYRFCYFSNLMAHLPATPLAAAAVGKAFGGFDGRDDYGSRYGATAGWNGPNQGRELWIDWVPEQPAYVEPDAVPSAVKDRMRATVTRLQRIAAAPFVNKWPPNSMRVRLLAEVFPNALFVRISRAPEATAKSILRGRSELCRRGPGWFSVKPPGYAQVMQDRSLEKQAVWQIDTIERILDADATAIGAERFMHVHYEELTARPRQTLESFAAFYGRVSGRTLEKRREVPESFSRSAAVPQQAGDPAAEARRPALPLTEAARK